MDRLAARCGAGALRLWVKRDDCTGLATGGNKARKLEFLVADAIQRGADTLVTTGGIQSNHARQTAAAAARHGLRCVLVLSDTAEGHGPSYRDNGNVLLNHLLGADVRVVGGELGSAAEVESVASSLRADGRKPYLIPLGGSNGLGTMGYVVAFQELSDQFAAAGERLDAIVLATGSGGTQAGLLAGAALADWRGAIIGISVGRPADQARLRVKSALEAAGRMPEPDGWHVPDSVIVIDDRFTGRGYGHASPECAAAMRLAAETEGLLLDPVYTGKAMAGLLNRVREGTFGDRAQNVVFLHTGGVSALGGYPELAASWRGDNERGGFHG